MHVTPAGNKGIGYEIARLLAEAGTTVVLASRSEEKGQEALSKLCELPSTLSDAGFQITASVDALLWPLKLHIDAHPCYDDDAVLGNALHAAQGAQTSNTLLRRVRGRPACRRQKQQA